MNEATKHKFVLMVSNEAMEHEVVQISKQVANLLRAKVCSSPRDPDSLLHDAEQGIRDNLYLSTRLTPDDMNWILEENLGQLKAKLSLQWLNS